MAVTSTRVATISYFYIDHAGQQALLLRQQECSQLLHASSSTLEACVALATSMLLHMHCGSQPLHTPQQSGGASGLQLQAAHRSNWFDNMLREAAWGAGRAQAHRVATALAEAAPQAAAAAREGRVERAAALCRLAALEEDRRELEEMRPAASPRRRLSTCLLGSCRLLHIFAGSAAEWPWRRRGRRRYFSHYLERHAGLSDGLISSCAALWARHPGV